LDDVAADHSIDAPTAVRQQFIPQKT
jgi:hypothetical protein